MVLVLCSEQEPTLRPPGEPDPSRGAAEGRSLLTPKVAVRQEGAELVVEVKEDRQPSDTLTPPTAF